MEMTKTRMWYGEEEEKMWNIAVEENNGNDQDKNFVALMMKYQCDAKMTKVAKCWC